MSCARAHHGALLSLSFCLLATASCRNTSEPTPSNTPATDIIVSATPPFKTKEPESYSATRTITSSGPNGERSVTNMLIGRDGLVRREESRSGATGIIYLDSPEGRFIVWPERKVYALIGGDWSAMPDVETEEDSPDRLLHTDPMMTTFQPLGTETVGGRNAAKFRVVVNNSVTDNVNSSETLIWIDAALNMPIKSEMRSSEGVLIVTELSDITLQPDKQLFQIPAGYEKIGFGALQKQLKARGLNP